MCTYYVPTIIKNKMFTDIKNNKGLLQTALYQQFWQLKRNTKVP